jgi:hypothetical protein
VIVSAIFIGSSVLCAPDNPSPEAFAVTVAYEKRARVPSSASGHDRERRYAGNPPAGASAEIVAQAVAVARKLEPSLDERDAVAAIDRFSGVWAALFPAEQARIVRLLVERVTMTADGLAVDLRTEGLGTDMREMLSPKREKPSHDGRVV